MWDKWIYQIKKRANVVGGRETSKPSEVHKHMEALLREYNLKEVVTVEDIIALHAEFEYIHPFQDGNGKVGRLVALKECLRHNTGRDAEKWLNLILKK